MNSKEALKEICINCRNNINQIPSKGDRPYKECPYRGISNDYCEEYETIKKDLEILEIIKSSIYRKEEHKYIMDEKMKGEKFMILSIHIRGTDNVNKIKEWLGNDNFKK